MIYDNWLENQDFKTICCCNKANICQFFFLLEKNTYEKKESDQRTVTNLTLYKDSPVWLVNWQGEGNELLTHYQNDNFSIALN